MSLAETKRHTTPLVEITQKGDVLLIKPIGPSVGQREAPIIQDEAQPFIDDLGSDLKHIVLDLTTVSFMSSMGLGMCISFRNNAVAVKADAILFGLSADLHSLMSMMKIEKLYKIAKDQQHLDKLIG
jgi:anti-anti-sigma factor